ncbi:carbamoyltransferase HypF [Thioalkalivibrio denitrificans]|uniref:Carbamoyltransferase HypF n=1 Tax=Thioalkalivibrio denitrificans TaxID=108003 RepID=A0A1V3NBN9_9GAMM|nr:carbamoyltransferase HypF [Thioalkalivibrio denitrificans]OOG22434.1 carbamoyltransferase HypF [Thioalkalivibrio denitrificans]
MSPETRRLRIAGQVQGVGYRPFVYRRALVRGISGWVQNRTGEVLVEAAGEPAALDAFTRDLLHEAPPLARPRLVEQVVMPGAGAEGFRILESDATAPPRIHVPPDFFTCDDCLQELCDPQSRRYRYPFINCTQCGPRYTLIRALPYDRANTAMAGFPLCGSCRAEYESPVDRRFHAEPLACAACGPTLTFRDADGEIIGNEAAMAACIESLRVGRIVAVKGVGGYHLLCDAGNPAAVARLRERKHRPHKPLAVLFPWSGADGLDILRLHATPSDNEARLLASPDRPIVLVRLRVDHGLTEAVAPGLCEVGAMLPYSPLHHLLSRDFGAPLVATSANRSGEPVFIDAGDVESALATVADAFLHHDRPILRPADDSVVRIIAGRARRLRIGRGLAPLELDLPRPVARPTLAVGGHMKNTVALAWEGRLVISPHIGELDSPRSLAVFEQVIHDLCALYRIAPECVLHDAHPGYGSTRWAIRHAERHGLELRPVFHHRAHAAMLAGEQPEVPRWLVFTWDGTGYGEDATIWGGEALLGSSGQWQRVASLRSFRLPGGEKAGRDPWRSAAALAWETGLDWRPDGLDVSLARTAWLRHVNSPVSSAAGRVFDACAALAGVMQRTSYEAQAPMVWEALCRDRDLPEAVEPLPLAQDASGLWRTDWAPLVALMSDASVSRAERSARMHAMLAESLVAQAMAVREAHGEFTVGLSGGVFLNRVLVERVMQRLEAQGFAVYLPERVPHNDAGLSYGQIIEGALAAQA